MAARSGEDIAATLFADVHYYYGPPSAIPPHHRFNKGSYVYLYEHAQQRRARLEIANNAGTPEQDAFDGYLDSTFIQYSYRQSTLVTLVVDGDGRLPLIDHNQWHLPSYDPSNKDKYLYRLHTLDMYFYTKEDAQTFVNTIRRVLPERQLKIEDEMRQFAYARPTSHAEPMSPLVQSLENVAITTGPGHRDSRSSAGSSQPHSGGYFQSQPATQSLPGPPAMQSFQGPPTPAPSFPGPPKAEPQTVPMAYNPAAPAAPEAIVHREKRPPPEDDTPNPLMVAAAQDQGQASSGYSPYAAQSPFLTGSYFAGPPKAVNSPYGPGSAPAPHHHAQVVSPQPPQQIQYAQQPLSPGLASPGFTGPPSASAAPVFPGSPPIGGYSNYTYTRSQTAPVNNGYNIHQQIYRPTEEEGKVKHHMMPKNPRGKLEDSAVKVEKGVTSFLKKLEKKYG